MDMNAGYGSKEEKWNVTAEVNVPGLGDVRIQDCVPKETVEKLCAEVLFALEQKMGIAHG